MTDCALPAVIYDGVIDVSHHNGAIDWPAVAGAGIALAFIKATQGVGFVDPTFERNRNAAMAAGILAVPYHFLDTSDPDQQAGPADRSLCGDAQGRGDQSTADELGPKRCSAPPE